MLKVSWLEPQAILKLLFLSPDQMYMKCIGVAGAIVLGVQKMQEKNSAAGTGGAMYSNPAFEENDQDGGLLLVSLASASISYALRWHLVCTLMKICALNWLEYFAQEGVRWDSGVMTHCRRKLLLTKTCRACIIKQGAGAEGDIDTDVIVDVDRGYGRKCIFVTNRCLTSRKRVLN